MTDAQKMTDYRCRCLRCGHSWIKRSEARPGLCPRCRSPRWDSTEEVETVPREQCVCLRCRHVWIPRVEGRPMLCPACQSRSWDTAPTPAVETCHCLHCEHTWTPRRVGRPALCPRCLSRRWDAAPPPELVCLWCEFRWRPRVAGRPALCPRCRHAWDQAPRRCAHCHEIIRGVHYGGHVTVWGLAGGPVHPECRDRLEAAIRVECGRIGVPEMTAEQRRQVMRTVYEAGRPETSQEMAERYRRAARELMGAAEASTPVSE